MNDSNGSDWLKIGTPRCGLLFGAFGVALAFLLLFLGFWKTLLVALFFAGGYWLGRYESKSSIIKSTINKLFPPRGE